MVGISIARYPLASKDESSLLRRWTSASAFVGRHSIEKMLSLQILDHSFANPLNVLSDSRFRFFDVSLLQCGDDMLVGMSIGMIGDRGLVHEAGIGACPRP